MRTELRAIYTYIVCDGNFTPMAYARKVVQKQMNDKHVMLKKKVLLAKY